MNVYDHIDANNRRSALLLCAFPIALFVTLLLFSLLATWASVISRAYTGFAYLLMPKDLNSLEFVLHTAPPEGIAARGLAYTLKVYPWMLAAVFLWIAFSYRAGGAMLLSAVRARRVLFEENRDLFRLVENTSIMAGLPTPKVYLIPDESMNAFAAGCIPDASSIALTHGIVRNLSEAELQAIVAHELAHIGNRDTRLMMIVVTGIGCFTFFGELLFRGRSGRRGSRNLIGFIVGGTCLMFGNIVAPLLRFALSRRREFLADATAARIIHDPDVLAGALSKIADNPGVELLNSTPWIGNLCVVDPTRKSGWVKWARKLYATHPPIGDRISVLRNMAGKNMNPTGKKTTAQSRPSGRLIG